MPITKGAIRKQRADRVKTAINDRVRKLYRLVLKKARQKPTPQSLSAAYRGLDRAAKAHVIHRNKAARLKSRLSKLLPKSKPVPKPAAKSPTKTVKNKKK